MKKRNILLLLAISFSQLAFAQTHASEANLIKLLETNKVVGAAIAEAKAFTGAKTCKYKFAKLEYPKQFEAGTAFDFNVDITCATLAPDLESQGFIHVEGTWLNGGKGPQDIQNLSLHFAG
jgi:hypothetical protein